MTQKLNNLHTRIKKSAAEYIKGNITLSEAAFQAGLTLWEIEK